MSPYLSYAHAFTGHSKRVHRNQRLRRGLFNNRGIILPFGSLKIPNLQNLSISRNDLPQTSLVSLSLLGASARPAECAPSPSRNRTSTRVSRRMGRDRRQYRLAFLQNSQHRAAKS